MKYKANSSRGTGPHHIHCESLLGKLFRDLHVQNSKTHQVSHGSMNHVHRFYEYVTLFHAMFMYCLHACEKVSLSDVETPGVHLVTPGVHLVTCW